jgi:hypothetical protein
MNIVLMKEILQFIKIKNEAPRHGCLGASQVFTSPNVPAVYDILPARIRACGASPGLAKYGGVRRGNGAQRNDLAERSPSRRYAAKHIPSCYATFFVFYYFLE